MSRIDLLFATGLYRATLPGGGSGRLNRDLVQACRGIAAEDRAGQAWCRRHRYPGYTSYASLEDLPWRSPELAALAQSLDGHAQRFARDLDFDLRRRRLALDSIWINILTGNGGHGAHIHPHAVLSGTCYVAMPLGSGAIRFEDPRLPLMMAAPVRRPNARRQNRTFQTIQPKAGTLLMWESWLRHEVIPGNANARRERISISFNYGWR